MNKFICTTNGCDATVMDFDQMVEHLKTVHGVDIETVKGIKRMIMHLDGREWFETRYSWVIGEITLEQQVRHQREANDPMRGGF
jgi:hypothetical protein